MIAKKAGQILIEKTEENVTGKVGLHWIYESMRHMGLKERIKYRFRVKRNHRSKTAWEKISASVLMLLSGGSCVEDIEYLKEDKGLLKSLGLKSMISPDTLLRFIGNKRTVTQLKKVVTDTAIKALEKYDGETITYDNDATYFNSGKDCAEYSYQKEKQMSALLGYSPELNGACMTVQYRPGNVSPASGILEDLKEAHQLCKKTKKRLTQFRSDSAAHNMAIFQYCEKNNIHFFVTLDKNSSTKRDVSGIKEKTWSPLEGQRDLEWAEFTHAMAKGKKNRIAMRALALRWPNPDPTLFDETAYCYHIIATNDPSILPMEWLKVHNSRMNSENYHKELKSNLAGAYTPSHSLVKNVGFFMLNLIAYNVFVLFKTYYLSGLQKSWTIKTFRYRVIHICARFVSHSRQVICKLINVHQDTFSLFKHCFSKFQLSG